MTCTELRNKVPEHTIGGLDKWVSDGCPPGGFLYAVLTHELFEAFARADEVNRAALFDIVSYIYNVLPLKCHGSEVHVAKWRAEKELERKEL